MVETETKKLSKNAKKKAKKKERKKLQREEAKQEEVEEEHKEEEEAGVEVEYVSAQYDSVGEFEEVFKRFATAELLTQQKSQEPPPEESKEPEEATTSREPTKNAIVDEPKGLSRRKRKQLSRMSVAELKQVVSRPEAVEGQDITASDPRLLVHLKSYRNAVPVPRHWCHKRRYLQGKRGVEKRPFALPEFIAQTGIEKIRKAIEEAEALKKIKAKSRDRVAGRTGRMDVDYQVLHDAFFKWQTKPRLSGPGALYYEGKEYEVHMLEKKPGSLSASLKAALGMPDGAPPPWLINMQRFGPPPSYPNLRIPGLNAPIPDGATFGYHPGGWGKPPVDEYGIPLYGDVFGARAALQQQDTYVPDRTLWGEMAIQEDDDESDEDDIDEQQPRDQQNKAERRERRERRLDDGDDDASGIETPLDDASTIVSGLQTPESAVDLRKRAGFETPDSSTGIQSTERALYQIIDEAKVRGAHASSALFSSDKRYLVPQTTGNEQQQQPEDSKTSDDDPSRKRRPHPSTETDRSKRHQRDFKF